MPGSESLAVPPCDRKDAMLAIVLRLLKQAKGRLSVVFGATNELVVEIDRAVADIATLLPDPRDPRPEDEMAGRDPVFRNHNCWKCRDGQMPCVKGNPRVCENLHARND